MSRKTVSGIIIAATAIVVAVALYAAVDPSSSRLFPKCPFYVLTGLKCPGCGTQRAIHQLLHLNIGQAIHYNALMVASIPLMVFLGAANALRDRHPRLYLASRNPVLSWAVLAVVLLWMLFRNVFGW